uniref:Uncharacterized protein n=1 Tax=Arundo donax TaxID=35708 RepID=A0A0A9HRL4_ARUDO
MSWRYSTEGISAGIGTSVVIRKLRKLFVPNSFPMANIYKKLSREIFHRLLTLLLSLRLNAKKLVAPCSIAKPLLSEKKIGPIGNARKLLNISKCCMIHF